MDTTTAICIGLVVYFVLDSLVAIIMTTASKLKKTHKGLISLFLTLIGISILYCTKSNLTENFVDIMSICYSITAVLSLLLCAWGIMTYD